MPVPAGHPSMTEEVRTAFDRFPRQARTRLLDVRSLLFDVSDEQNVGPLTETLKWGEPAYLTDTKTSGSTIRLAWSLKAPEAAQVLFICTTRLVDRIRERYGDRLTCAGNRAIHLPLDTGIPGSALAPCLAMALTCKRRATI